MFAFPKQIKMRKVIVVVAICAFVFTSCKEAVNSIPANKINKEDEIVKQAEAYLDTAMVKVKGYAMYYDSLPEKGNLNLAEECRKRANPYIEKMGALRKLLPLGRVKQVNDYRNEQLKEMTKEPWAAYFSDYQSPKD
jgi:hypothetical protein